MKKKSNMRSPLKPTGTQNIRELEKMNKRRTLDRDNFMLCILMQTFLFKPLKRSCNKLESTWEYGRRSLVLSCKLGQQLLPANNRRVNCDFGSQSKYKCSIIQTEQNTTKNSKYKHDKIQKNKIQIAKIQT